MAIEKTLVRIGLDHNGTLTFEIPPDLGAAQMLLVMEKVRFDVLARLEVGQSQKVALVPGAAMNGLSAPKLEGVTR